MSIWGRRFATYWFSIKMFSVWVEDSTLIFNYICFLLTMVYMNHNTNISSLYVNTNPPMFDLGCVQQSRYDLGSNWVQVAPAEGSQQQRIIQPPKPKPTHAAYSVRRSNFSADHESP